MFARTLLAILLLSSLASSPVALASPQSDSSAALAAEGEMPIQRLVAAFVGRWSVSETHEPSEWSPEGAKGEGNAEFRPGPGGLSLIQEYSSTSSMGEFEGHGITWWDEEVNAFRGIWCENTSPAGCENLGLAIWEGDQLITEFAVKTYGEKTKVRRIIKLIEPDHFTAVFEMAIGDEPLRPAMRIDYRRLP